MNNPKNNLQIKKRMMFETQEDFYFVVYNILLILKELDCHRENRFTDFTKLAYIYPFVSNNNLANILELRLNGDITNLESEDIDLLSRHYYESRLKMRLILNLISVLKVEGFIDIEKNTTRNSFDIWITNKDKLEFLDDRSFDLERNNFGILKRVIPRIRTITVKKVVEELYEKAGVIIWEV